MTCLWTRSFLVRCLLIGFVLGIGGCETSVYQEGKMLGFEKMTTFVPGKTKQVDVLKIFGTPSCVDPLDEDIWYYVSRSFSYHGPLKLLTHCDVYLLTWRKDGSLDGIEHRDVQRRLNVARGIDNYVAEYRTTPIEDMQRRMQEQKEKKTKSAR